MGSFAAEPHGSPCGISAEPARDPLFEQIARLLGGWSFDQERGSRAWRDAGRPDESPAARGEARVFLRRSHALQCAMQAERAGAESPAIVAALLHDVGHFYAPPPPAGREETWNDLHEVIGAHWLASAFVPEVSQPVLHHVTAKRYLVTVRDGYADHLGPDSARTLARQGGTMSDDEIGFFRSQPFWQQAVDLRVWDDDAKHWDVPLRPLAHFVPHLEAALRQ